MIWIVGGGLALGFGLCCLAIAFSWSSNMHIYHAAPIPLLAGLGVIAAAVVLLIGNAVVHPFL